jgi:hypothetical protein
MSKSFLFIVSFGIGGGAVWRAVFVAALALIAFALIRYWQSLAGHSRGTRLSLVSLRAASLLLLACALAGVRVEYEAVTQPRVLIYRAGAEGAKVDARESAAGEVAGQLQAALRAKNVEVVERQAEDFESEMDETAPYLASIVLTDGAMRATDARREIERASAATGGTPVYVLTDFQTTESPRVALESITVMSRPVRGVPLSVRCLVHARGMQGRASLVTIQDDAQVRSSVEARWMSDDERQVLTLEVVPKAAGWANYTARVEAAGTDEDDAARSRGFTIYVEERRPRVLFFEGEPTWEAKFIRRALEEAELFEVDYFAQVSRAAVVGVKEQPPDESAGQTENVPKTESNGKTNNEAGGPDAKLRAVLASASRLNQYDCIIIGATPDAMLSNAESSRLRDWVETRGGGLVVLGGNGFAGSLAAPNAKLYALLPALIDASSFRADAQTQASNAPVEAEKSRGGTPLTPTQVGAGGPLRGFLSASEGTQKAAVLTGQGLRLGALRAGASVLAVSGPASADGTSEAGMPLMAARRFGAGRTILFSPADSWRIRASASGEEAEKGGPFAALWQGIALWASNTSRPPVELALSDESPAAGNIFTAELRVRDETSFGPLKIEKLNARLHSLNEDSAEPSSAETVSREIAFAPDLTDASIWRARFALPAPGKFNLDIEYTAQGKTGAAEKYFAIVPKTSTAAGASRDTLQRTARETGGELYTASALNSLTEKISALPQSRERVRRAWELRTFWPLALLIPLLLSGEWLIARMKSREKGGIAIVDSSV